MAKFSNSRLKVTKGSTIVLEILEFSSYTHSCVVVPLLTATGLVSGKWKMVKYNRNFIYLHLFLKNSPTGQTGRWIFALDGSNDADLHKDVSFGGFVDTAPHLGGEIHKTPMLGRVNERFRALLKLRPKALYKCDYYYYYYKFAKPGSRLPTAGFMSHHLQADCQELGSALEPYAR